MNAQAYFPVLVNKQVWLASDVSDFQQMRVNKCSLDFRGYFCLLCQPALITEAILTCPARVAAAVATDWITAISMSTVAALTALQPIGAILITTNTSLPDVQCSRRIKTQWILCSALLVKRQTYRAGLVTVLSPPPRRACTDAIYRVTCSSIGT